MQLLESSIPTVTRDAGQLGKDTRKILLFYSGFAHRGGGVVTQFRTLAQALIDRGVEVKVISLDNFIPFSYLLPAVERLVDFFAYPLGFIFRNVLCKLLWALYTLFPLSQRSSFIFEDMYTVPGAIAKRKPLVFLHALKSDQSQGRKKRSWAYRLLLKMERNMVAFWQPCTVSEEYNKGIENKYGIKLKDVIPNGVETENYYIGEKENLVLFVGNLEPRKNPLFAFEALSELRNFYPDFHAIFAGNGPLSGLLKQKIGDIKEFEAPGGIYSKDKTDLMSRAKILILPSLQETFGIVLLEAKLSGCATIAAKGLEVPPELVDFSLELDSVLWAEKMASIFEDFSVNEEEINRLREKYSARKMAQSALELLGNGPQK